jgi:hypothetical protein
MERLIITMTEQNKQQSRREFYDIRKRGLAEFEVSSRLP